MSNQLETATCQRCGKGFVLTTGYRNLLARRGVKVATPVLCPTCFLATGPRPKKCGQVKWFSPDRRYGFIITQEDEEVFFHESQIVEGDGDRPKEGQQVLFHVSYRVKGPEALNVEFIE